MSTSQGSDSNKSAKPKPKTATASAASCRSTKLPDATNPTTDDQTAEKPKRLPPIKAPVGLAKGPDLSKVRSKVGSLQNVKHTTPRTEVKLVTQKLNWNAQSKVGSLENAKHQPGGGKLKVESRKLNWETSSRVQSFENVKHKPGGGNVKIFHEPIIGNKNSDKDKAHSAKPKSSSNNNNDANNNVKQHSSNESTSDRSSSTSSNANHLKKLSAMSKGKEQLNQLEKDINLMNLS